MLSSKLTAQGLLAMAAVMAESADATGRLVCGPKLEQPIKSRKSHPNAQPRFRMKRQGKTYPFSSTHQDERQRLQFQCNTAKAAAKFEREYAAFRKFESERMGTKPYVGSAA